MPDPDLQELISELGDVDLVRMLTIDADDADPRALALAEAEAKRRGLPIDPSFIPSEREEPARSGPFDRFEIAGSDVTCPHCLGDVFDSREILLNTRGMSFLGLDWLNESATALTCTRCGQVQFFAGVAGAPERRLREPES